MNQLTKENKAKLLDFAKKAAKIGNRLLLDTEPLTPENFGEEKARFFGSATYNPQFKYKKKNLRISKNDIQKLKKELHGIRLPKDLKHYLEKYLRDLSLLYIAHKKISTQDFSEISRKLFNWDFESIDEVLESLKDLKLKPSHDLPKDAQQIKKYFEKTLKNNYKIKNYTVLIDEFNNHTIRVGTNKLKIGSKVKRSHRNIKRLIVHEIETHVLQKNNVARSKNPLLKLLLYKDWWLYAEGLAVYNEIKTDTISKSAFDIYKARLIAVKNHQRSFRQIYNELVQFVSSDKAYITAYRIKRGLGDTSEPGGFLKDAAYLLGYSAVKDYVLEGGKIEFLFIYRVPHLGRLLTKYDLLDAHDFKLPKFIFKIGQKI